jgi:hypothetical protein
VARIDDYKESFRLAAEALGRIDLQQAAERAGLPVEVEADGATLIRISLLGGSYTLKAADVVDVTRAGDAGDVPLPEKILICHYLLNASGTALTRELVTFRQIPDGHFYFDAFQRRARDPFLATFGKDIELFRTCGGELGGKVIEAGDAGMEFEAMPGIPIQLLIWQGDDEFEPDAGILFDSNIQRKLPIEDVAVLSSMLVYRLMGIARGVQSGNPRK